MKNGVILISIVGLLYSCDIFKPEPVLVIPDIEHYTIIVNNSTHTIRLDRLWHGEIHPFTIYPDHQRVVFFNEVVKEFLFFPTLGDSAMVVYDDDLTVLHTKQDVQDVSRSIMLESSYTGGKVNDKLYEIYYTFTDADYDEAVLINEGG